MRLIVFRGDMRGIPFASEVFSADACVDHFEILRKEKRLVDKVHGSGRLRQATLGYIARKG
jgi:hypothetical protein